MKFAAKRAKDAAGPPFRQRRERTVGSWQTGRRIGQGTYFELLAARPLDSAHSGYDFVLKIPRAEYRSSERIGQLLIQEAKSLQSFQSPHILPLVDQGPMVEQQKTGVQQETAEAPYLVLPIVAGHNLAELGRTAGRIPELTAVWIARQAAQALEVVHQAGWLHGDLKPENILVSPTGHATLIDFSLAHPIRPADFEHIPDLVGRGTLRYMAPERLVVGYPLGPAADLYSLGATLFEILLGLPLRGEANPDQIAQGHLCVPLPPQALFGLQPNLAKLLGQMLAKDPIRRPDSAGKVAQELARIETTLLAQLLDRPAA